ncbi:MAG: WYL domain-containing protein [Clostridiales bacterium]|nr:WYL domain-containing protein [Clostridiales bacterium]
MVEERKGKDTSVSQRQIYILSLLSENPKGYQAEEIRQRLHNWGIDVSRRTITRDIDELSLNYGIGEEERGGKTYYFADKYTLKNVDFTIEDLASLAFTKEMLKEYSHLRMGSHAISFIDKIVEQSASLNKLQFDALGSHFKHAGIRNDSRDVINADVEKMIQNAIDNQNKIEIEYYSFSSDESTRRVVHPYQLLLIDSYLCVEGYCELRKEVRRFRLSRIQKMEVLDVKFDLEKELSEFAKKNETFLKLSGEKVEELVLLFTGESIRYVKEYEAKRSKRLEETEKGLYFYGETAIAPDVIRWIRGFGPEVQVIEPAWLAKQLYQEAETLIRR